MVEIESAPHAGDFWHVRGSLPVQPLNAVLQEFKSWKQPTLMLVGNHDQARLQPAAAHLHAPVALLSNSAQPGLPCTGLCAAPAASSTLQSLMCSDAAHNCAGVTPFTQSLTPPCCRSVRVVSLTR